MPWPRALTGFMADEGGIKKQLRHWRDTNCKDGFGHGLWKQFAEMGLTGMLAAEADGGARHGPCRGGDPCLPRSGRNLTPVCRCLSNVRDGRHLR
jgi:alkylation response protein AidB-like acyl-CoA dehydrogenase